MTTLAQDKPRSQGIGDVGDYPIIAADIIYEGAAEGVVDGTGLVRPLVAGDRFAGFCMRNCDNSAGAAGAKYVRTRMRGAVQIAVSGAVITDIGQPVYATDDDTFSFLPTGGSFIGIVRRFVSFGVVVAEYDAAALLDPYGTHPRVTLSTSTTLTALAAGRDHFITADATVTTLLAVEGLAGIRVVNMGAFGTQAVTVTPNASDMIEGPGITGADAKYMVNTKATARRGDYIELEYADANGWVIRDIRGIWARET